MALFIVSLAILADKALSWANRNLGLSSITGPPSFAATVNSLIILDEFIKNFSPNKKQMLSLANLGYINATDLADYLVKNYSMSFREAYKKTATIVNFAEKKKKNLSELSLEELKEIEPKLNGDVLMIFDLKNSIKSKKSFGGTSFENVKRMIMTEFYLDV